ncbi:MAG: family 10 glycosylhydrolase [Candidatus Marinimicrobia bacterium]|nr:family 10 glycosylhydrolase [Candidatus Neomarinimicrobiota bacterium]
MRSIMRVLLISLLIGNIFANPADAPKQEFRGVWLSTVANIDWPEDKYDSEAKKQADLIKYLDTLKVNGINAVVFQVRPACDAMYNSPYEPWSYWFSGTQGEGPAADSLWDPLTFAVEEAHKRGMELHAWVNPYRAVHKPAMIDSSFYLDESHVAKTHPEWILKFNSVYILDPGQEAVRNYIRRVFMDIVCRYDIDGIHMDDYFYPYSGVENEDSLTFEKESRGFEDINDWRRDNINLLVQTVSDSIDEVKPWVKWGISPFGIYRPNVPEGIEGFDAWSVLYCDPLAWLQAGSVDYITPQCYWPFGGGQDYGKLIPYWSALAKKYKRHFYPGQALYRAGSDKFPEGEIARQVRLNREIDGCQGSIYFTANNFFQNPKNTIDTLKEDLYANKALWPVFSHQKGKALKEPVVFSERMGDEEVMLTWDVNPEAWAYVVYRSKTQQDLGKSGSSIHDIATNGKGNYLDLTNEQWFYAVTALNNYKLESRVAHVIYDFVAPLKPVFDTEVKAYFVPFVWEKHPQAETYHIQVATDKDFSFIVYEERLLDRNRLNKKLPKAYTYYWRVKADNTNDWSPIWTFKR